MYWVVKVFFSRVLVNDVFEMRVESIVCMYLIVFVFVDSYGFFGFLMFC